MIGAEDSRKSWEKGHPSEKRSAAKLGSQELESLFRGRDFPHAFNSDLACSACLGGVPLAAAATQKGARMRCRQCDQQRQNQQDA